jgi:hypothetical protein
MGAVASRYDRSSRRGTAQSAKDKIERAVRSYSAAALVLAADDPSVSIQDVVSEFLTCLQSQSNEEACCDATLHRARTSNERTLCLASARLVQEGLADLREAVGPAEAEQYVARTFPKEGLVRRLLRTRKTMISLLLALFAFFVWVHTPMITEYAQAEFQRDAPVSQLVGGDLGKELSEKGFRKLEKTMRIVYKQETPREQLATLLEWAKRQPLSLSTVMSLIKSANKESVVAPLTRSFLSMWLNKKPFGVESFDGEARPTFRFEAGEAPAFGIQSTISGGF